jgi:hypothetical protein
MAAGALGVLMLFIAKNVYGENENPVPWKRPDAKITNNCRKVDCFGIADDTTLGLTHQIPIAKERFLISEHFRSNL